MAEVMERDEKFAASVRDFYGEYLGTYYSERRQVRADLFAYEGRVTGYVVFLIADPDDVTDKYVTGLREHISKMEYDPDCLRLIYTE